jgi:hypothetical protein
MHTLYSAEQMRGNDHVPDLLPITYQIRVWLVFTPWHPWSFSAIPRLLIRISRMAPAGMGLVSAFDSLAYPGITLEARLSRLDDQIQGRSWPKTLAVLP